jgi:predicted nucleic acid-binding protein
VVVSGLIRGGTSPARVLDAAVAGEIAVVLSLDLLDEYEGVPGREHIQRRLQGRGSDVVAAVDGLRANAMVVEPDPGPYLAPDPGDQHLWDLLGAVPDAILVTGDRRLLESADYPDRVLSPRQFVDTYLASS